MKNEERVRPKNFIHLFSDKHTRVNTVSTNLKQSFAAEAYVAQVPSLQQSMREMLSATRRKLALIVFERYDCWNHWALHATDTDFANVMICPRRKRFVNRPAGMEHFGSSML
jgi:hypothetical protein